MSTAKTTHRRNNGITLVHQERFSGRRKYKHRKSGEISPLVNDSDELTDWFAKADLRHQPATSAPSLAGLWHNSKADKVVTVEETVAAGRYCRELRQGGSMQCGFGPWQGLWRYVGPPSNTIK